MKRCRYICLVMLLAAAAAGAQGEPPQLTWLDAINQALDANQSLASARESLEAQAQAVKQARAGFLPTIELAAQGSFSESVTFSETQGVLPTELVLGGASLSQMIYNEQTFANHTVQKELYTSQDEGLQDTSNGIVLSAGQAYLGVLLAEDLLAIQLENLRLTEENVRVTQVQVDVGAATMQSVLRYRSQQYGIEQGLVSQEANVVVNRFALNQVRNRPVEELYTLERVNVEKNGFVFSSSVVDEALADDGKARRVRDYLVELGLSVSPALRSLDASIVAQQRQLTADHRWLIPSASFTANAARSLTDSGTGPDFTQTDVGNWKVQGTLTWVPFNGGASIARVHEASADLRSLEAQRIQLQTSLEQSIRANVAIASSAYLQIGLAREQVGAAEQNYRLVYDAYLSGETTLLDLLDAQAEQVSAASSLTSALYSFLAQLLATERAMGYFPFLQPQAEVDQHVTILEQRLQSSP